MDGDAIAASDGRRQYGSGLVVVTVIGQLNTEVGAVVDGVLADILPVPVSTSTPSLPL